MNLRHLTIALASITLLGFSTPAHAAKGKKRGGQGHLLSRLDRDQSGVIDGKEAKRAQAMYAELAALDTNKDFQLSDAELAAAKVPAATPGAKKTGKKAQ
jgi:hypothetical protein